MNVKTRHSTKWYYTKVLVIVTILACINVASTLSVAKGVARSSQTLETRKMGRVDVSDRFLRSDNFMTTDERVNAFQERSLAVNLAGLQNVATSVKSRLSSLIQKLQLQWWRLRQKSPNDVFTLLKLDKTGDKLLESPVFSQWAAFVTVRSKSDPDMAMFATLAAHYSDDALTKMLIKGKEVEKTNVFATKLEGLQMTNWLNAGESADDVFKALKLHQTGDKLFESPVLSQWVSFVAKRNSKDPELTMFSTFAKHYSDDALAKMLVTAKEVKSTKTIATKMEGLQMANWINAGNSADDVFKALKLDQTGDKLFESPLFSYWASFVAKQNNKDPGTEMFTTFGKYYSDDALAKILPTRILATAKNVDSTKAVATKLEGLQIESWVTAEKSADDVFKILELDRTGDKVFESPVFSTWTTFVSKINKNDADEVITKQLTDKLGDVAVAKMIWTAKNDGSTKKLATGLGSVQFTNWYNKGETPQSVNTLLNVAENSDDVTKKISQDYEKFYNLLDSKLRVGDR